MASGLGFGRIVNRVPVPVEKPLRISFHGVTILITVPTKVSVSPVLNLKNTVTKTSLAKCRVTWLWLCKAAQHSDTRTLIIFG